MIQKNARRIKGCCSPKITATINVDILLNNENVELSLDLFSLISVNQFWFYDEIFISATKQDICQYFCINIHGIVFCQTLCVFLLFSVEKGSPSSICDWIERQSDYLY